MPRLFRTLAVAALSLTATPGLAQPVNGVFDSDCTAIQAGAFTDGRVELRPGRIMFHESSCTLTNPVAVRDMNGAMLYDGVCSGEGETWTRRLMIMPSFANGVVVASPGWARTLSLCAP